MNTIRMMFATIGLPPMVLIVVGLMLMFRKSSTFLLPLTVGLVWGFWNVLYSRIDGEVSIRDDEVTQKHVTPPPG